ncbi:MAG: hypothetical protein BGP24_14795 [Lysobacterales bacterium 69-70]|nr:helix-turn-helix transcriptional regulator [Xanthomonadaceae bacterium]ODU35353.1 MAG: hypothetical protein ABS97_05625 [Xanthomonadaceae bacterium SCN 69-320]ODV17184.1 MAG: hypothetical protein ABT27_17615 [Xanthomonadaceae bacterium SCN 69-25]OJY94249.1 MAG: hypothetical protein BGP24_14795 [Xanthomonadales bacterium 69-70]
MRNDLRKARIAAGLTQVEFARLIRKDQGTVSRIESGKQTIDVVAAPLIAAALGMDVLQVLYGQQSPTAAREGEAA